jgi:HEAT repeat protein
MVLCCGVAGCGETGRHYAPDLYRYLHPPDSLKVLRDPDSNGDDRRYALMALKEPLANGGTAEQQQLVLDILKYSALNDGQAVCRMAAYDALRKFKDPRAVDILKEAYYKTTSFSPETGTILRCQVLEALGETRNTGAIDLLVRVLREPPNAGTEGDKQQQFDERGAAARALGHYSDAQATNALVEVLRKEQDVALRTDAHHSLVLATGRDLPADAQTWSELLNNPTGKPLPGQEPSLKDRLYRLAGWNQGPDNRSVQQQPQQALQQLPQPEK